MRVVVTGAAGFIGSNLVHALNRRGIDDIVAVDELAEGAKFVNLREAQLADYFDSEEFYEAFDRGELAVSTWFSTKAPVRTRCNMTVAT